jgi:hypothetical protein
MDFIGAVVAGKRRRNKARAAENVRCSERVMGFDGAACATGAGEGIRTLDPNLGKVVLYH